MEIFRVDTSPEFYRYGRVLPKLKSKDALEILSSTDCPPKSTIYCPSDEKLEQTELFFQLQNLVFGDMPIQMGYCNGHNRLLQALEYHMSSEVNLAADDLVLLLGLRTEIEKDGRYNTENVKAFLLPAGTAVELYATTLHFAPCQKTEKGFRNLVILPKGTNLPLAKKEDGKELFAVNKWLLAHVESGLQKEGAKLALYGENIFI